ncbi:helix-turn-helix domain-containing protein [Streptomyces sp. p1417]|uniref:Helix-turn-helix domain-containing protein n=1 Tax=Streptomyces typhae TaxID=2681492 RepID=A0A6L6WTK3_9ACTN|nr:helix-turn-helix domain-containing protein [Streptomyces typhae]MVO85602.1 helix-turn-helix domain-containing protein [Streptomyces typhae]
MTDRGRGEHTAAARRLGGALRALQQRSGRTLRSLEEQVRISDSSLSRYFRGDTVPPWPVVRDVCRALGGDPTEYRVLWEAADRSRPEPLPEPAAAPPPAAPPPPAAVQGVRAARAFVRAGLNGRWTCAAAGAAAGLLTGVLVTVLVLPQDSPPGSRAAAPASSTGPTLPVLPAHPSQTSAPFPPARPADTLAKAPPGDGPTYTESAGATRPPEATRIFVSRATGNCLDDSLDKGLRSYACNGMPYQWWTVRRYADGARQLRNHATGKCLDHDPADLRTARCGAAPSQKWVFAPGHDEAVGLRNADTGRCLEDDGRAGLRAVRCSPTRQQKWA